MPCLFRARASIITLRLATTRLKMRPNKVKMSVGYWTGVRDNQRRVGRADLICERMGQVYSGSAPSEL